MGTTNKKWNELSIKEQTSSYIDYVDKKYHDSYYSESQRYERMNNLFHLVIIIIGFLVTIILALKDIIQFENKQLNIVLTIVTLCLPSVASVLLVYVSQKGYKKKEGLRENARIICKYLVNKAKIDYSTCKTDEDYKAVYYWLNEEIQQLQLNQASGYFDSQESMNRE